MPQNPDALPACLKEPYVVCLYLETLDVLPYKLALSRAEPFPLSKTKSSESAVLGGAHAGGTLQPGRHNLARE